MTAFTADVIVRTILSIPVGQDDAADIFRSFSRYQQRTVPALVLNLFGLPQGCCALLASSRQAHSPMACQTHPTAS